jgi:hypothetical protein
VTNIRILWKCPFRLQRYSFITTLFLGPFDDVITKFYCILIVYIHFIADVFHSLTVVSVHHTPSFLTILCVVGYLTVYCGMDELKRLWKKAIVA